MSSPLEDHMKTIKPLPALVELQRCFKVNPECPSGLERIGAPSPVPGGRARVGKLGPTGGIGSDGYWRVTFKGSSYRIHRIIWALTHDRDPLELVVDHRDGDPLNNHPDNLRACTEAENLQNKRSPGRRDPGVSVGLPKGVKRKGDAYVFSIMVRGEVHVAELANLTAVHSYARKVRDELHGEFARHD